MIKPEAKNKILLALFFLLFLAGFFEIFAYFFYIYKPASQIFGKAGGYRLEIPAVSQLLNSHQVADESVSLADSQKTIFSGKLSTFRSFIDKKLSAENTFVKSSKVDLILAGKVTKVEKLKDGSVNVVLTNSTGATVTEEFSREEINEAAVSVITVSPSNPAKVDGLVTDALPGDYMVIKVATDLLQDQPLYTVQVEIFKTPPSASSQGQ